MAVADRSLDAHIAGSGVAIKCMIPGFPREKHPYDGSCQVGRSNHFVPILLPETVCARKSQG